MTRVAVVGLTRIRGLGDAAQYYTIIRLVSELLPEVEPTFLCPNCKRDLQVFKGLTLSSNVLDLNSVPSPLSILSTAYQRYMSRKLNNITTTELLAVENTGTKGLLKLISGAKLVRDLDCILGHVLLSFSTELKSLNISYFDVGIIGGHTAFCACSKHYDLVRKMVKGPLIVAPVSIPIALHYWDLSTIRKHLSKCDFIYTRGPYSYFILKRYLRIDSRRISVALDSGFGIKLLTTNTASEPQRFKDKSTFRIAILPRASYLEIYGKGVGDLRTNYLHALAKVVLALLKKIDCEIILTSQIVGEQKDIAEFMSILSRRLQVEQLKRSIRVVKLRSLIDACMLYRNLDLVVTSYMHGGIFALSFGVPAIFVMPKADIKVLDVLSFLELDTNMLLVDMFEKKALNRLVNIVLELVNNLEYWRKCVEFAVHRKFFTIYAPVKKLAELVK